MMSFYNFLTVFEQLFDNFCGKTCNTVTLELEPSNWNLELSTKNFKQLFDNF